MLRNTLIALLLIPVLFSACKKGSDDSGIQIAISGVKTIDLNDATANTLTLNVTQTAGSKAQITLSIEGLPAGVTATIDTPTAVAPFTAKVVFNQSLSTAAGTYAVKVVGTSASYTKSYDFNLIIPFFNGWSLDEVTYKRGFYSFQSGVGISILHLSSTDNGGCSLDAIMDATLPTVDGTYMYKLVNNSSAPDEMSVSFSYTSGSGASYNTAGTDNHMATLKIADGKSSLSFPATLMVSTTGPGTDTKMLTMMVSE